MVIFTDFKTIAAALIFIILFIIFIGYITLLGLLSPGIAITAMFNWLWMWIFSNSLSCMAIWIISIIVSLFILCICVALNEKAGIGIYVLLAILCFACGFLLEQNFPGNIFSLTMKIMIGK